MKLSRPLTRWLAIGFAAPAAALAVVAPAAAQAPDLAVTKSHTDTFTAGATSLRYMVTITNVGDGLAESPTVVDQLPPGLKPVRMAGGAWSCTGPTGPCTSVHTPVLPGASFPALFVEVDVALTAPPQVTNTVSAFLAEDPNEANNVAADPTAILPAPPLAVRNAKALADGSARVSVAVPGPGSLTADEVARPNLIGVATASTTRPKTQRLRLRPTRGLERRLERGGARRVAVRFTFESVDGVTLTERRRIRFEPAA